MVEIVINSSTFNEHCVTKKILKFIKLFYMLDILHIQGVQSIGSTTNSEAYFNGSSYLRLQTAISLRKQTGVSFKTCYGGNLFQQTQNDDSIELLVNSEAVVFSAKVSGKQYETKVIGNYLNNKWHTVFMEYILGNLTIAVDGKVQLIANRTYRSDLLTNPNLYNEGATVLLIGKQFNGCLLEGPSIIFDPNYIMSSHNVVYETCPIPMDSCVPKEKMVGFDYCKTEPCMRHGTCINGQNTYSCVCLPRYTGKNCEIDLGDPCEKKPAVCRNSATCNSDPDTGEFECICPPGYAGPRCELEINTHPKCKTNPCRNGGTCNYNLQTDTVECRCKLGYSGALCDSNVDECNPNPCQNGGICIDGHNNFTCDCSHTGYKGVTCDLNINECLINPCENGGRCYDTYGSYLCQCPLKFGGKRCELNVDECSSHPCLNNGLCVSHAQGFECRCHPGFLGNRCEIEQRQQRACDPASCPAYAECGDEGCVCKPEYAGEYPNCNVDSLCAANPCKNGGVCGSYKGHVNCTCPPGFAGTCKNGGTCMRLTTGFYCACRKGLFTGNYCQKRVKCKHGPCQHASMCQDYLGGYYCTCTDGWTGRDCDTPLGLCYDDPCQNGGACLDHNHLFTCHCLPGFTGRLCQVNIDECQSNPCLNGGQCIDKINSFICNCTENWMGLLCEKPYDACELNPCENNGTCMVSPNKRDYKCSCPAGFEGIHCETNIDDCQNNRCPPHQICVDLVNKFECRCPAGYTGENCNTELDPCGKEPCNNGTCVVDKLSHQFSCNCHPGFTGPLCSIDINECSIPGSKICNNGICVNTEGSFQCYCMPGFTGERCNLDFNECLSMPCKNNATCVNLINNYECRCPPGYEGKDCSLNVDECSPNPCTAGSTCVDGINEFTCVCQPGLTGKLCEVDIDDCESSPCLNGAVCIDGLNSYTCDCADTGYEGLHCENNIDDCKGNPCQNGAECLDQVKDYTCNCYKGYVGKNCEVDINECESNPCQHSGICLEKSNMTLYNPSIVSKMNLTLPEEFERPFNYSEAAGYECLCVVGVMGPNCEIDINECESNPCQYGTCTDKIGGYVCECEDGYEGDHCEDDIDECAKYDPCVHGTCHDKIANYYCQCEPNFGGKNCSVELTGCVDKPCENNGQCRPYLVNETEHRFNCSCPNGFHGHTCERPTTMSFARNSLVTVNTTRDEGYDIQFRFKTTLGDGLLALGIGLTYYILELSRGRLNLQSSLLNKWEGVFIGSNLNDSKWQKVFVAINSTHVVLSANEEQTIYPITFNENYNVTSTSFPVTYIGGIPSNLRKLTRGVPFLVGCTEDVLINNEWVLAQNPNTEPWLSFQNIEVGCPRKPQCFPNPCMSGGHCTDRWRNFSCTCERPYLGNVCQYNYTAATFGYENITDSMVTVAVADYARRAVRTIVDISMFIRTRQARGQIFYLGSVLGNNLPEDTYIAAQLEGGELLVRIQFNGSLEAYTVGGVKLNNGYNHLIEVIRNVTLVQVKLNGTEYFRKTISAPGILDAQVLFLGGQPQPRSVRQTNENLATVKADVAPPTASAVVTASLSNVRFKGIIQDVQVSNGSTTMIVEFFPLKAKDLDIPMPFGVVTFDKQTVLPGVLSDDLCKENPCFHNGVCRNTWNDYVCTCTRGFKGKNCNELEFCQLEGCPQGSECKNLEDGYECIANTTFNGLQEPLKYHLTILPNSQENVVFSSLEVTYRTRSWGTVFFARKSKNYFTIFIYHNEVVVEWSLNGLLTTKRFRKDRFEGQWLVLYFLYKDQVFRGGFRESVVDESPNFEVTDFDISEFNELIKNGDIYVAGSDNKTFDYRAAIENTDVNMTGYIPASDTTTVESLVGNSLESNDVYSEDVLYKVDQDKKSDKFKGCLSEIRIGGLLLPFFTTNEIYRNQTYAGELFELLQPTKPELGCILCYDQDCSNQGYCVNNTETYKCNCNEGYTGDDCSIDINECENNQCRNNATCIDDVARYECECLPGYEGEHCEIDIDECQSNPCRHGGTCIDLIGNFKCDCPDDFVGKQCEAPLLITCENKPCRDGATCKTAPNEKTGNNFTCYCTEGMEGPLCDTPFCLRKHCEQGHCNTTGEVPYCQCQRGFEGEFCEINIDECKLTARGPCQNGGVCIDGISRYDCDCTGTGYTGLLCEMDIDECSLTEMPCGRSGICENMPGTYRCKCEEPGKCGHQCLLNDPCVYESPCIHGMCESKCIEKPDYDCLCEENYAGKNCTKPMELASESEGGLNILYIVIPIVLILLLAFLVGITILINVARSKRATRGTYSPSAQEYCNPRVELDHVLKPPPEERLI